jgi:hypothetical protein
MDSRSSSTDYLIRSFKRHYHRVKGVRAKLYSKGSFRFEIKLGSKSRHRSKE